MEAFWADFHFLRPWWLLAAVLPVVGCWRFLSGLKNVSAWEAVCDRNLLDFLLIKGSSRQRRLVAGMLLFGLLGAVVALAGPSWRKREIPVFAPENPVMFLLNMSSDMNQTDVTPNRLARAKYALADLLKSVSGAESGLVVYTDEPFLISPLTADGKVIENLLPAVVPDIMPENGDRLHRALDYAVERFTDAGFKKGSIVVLAADAGQDFNLAMISAAAAYAKGYRVNVVDAGAKGSEKLKMIADRGGGVYAGVLSGLSRLAAALSVDAGGGLKESQNEREIWEDAGYWLLFIPLVCALFFFRRGIFVWVLAFGLGGALPAEAGFFLNDNQEGLRAFRNNDFTTAAEKFELPAWKASSYYRSGDFDKAYEYFSGSDAESLYNQGNALAKSGKLEEAIKKYEEVLAKEPGHEDAEFNLEYIKRQQQQQQQQQSAGGGENDRKNDRNQSADGSDNRSGKSDNNNDNGNNEQQAADDNRPEQQSPSGGKGEEEDKNQQQPQEAESADDKQDNAQNDGDGQRQTPSPQEKQNESERQAEAQAVENEGQTGDGEKGYSEAVQAREQQFRDIPEDAGGLLRAFIRKEYMKNRYKDEGL